MVVDTATLSLVAKMPSSYAAMSPFEFLAELYALPDDLDDPLHKHVPADVAAWLDGKIGNPEPKAPKKTAAKPDAPHRPGRKSKKA